MKRDDILLIANRMIEERGGAQIDDKEELLRFAVVLGNRVTAAEREACAKVCDAEFWNATKRDGVAAGVAAGNCARAIRARGEKK